MRGDCMTELKIKLKDDLNPLAEFPGEYDGIIITAYKKDLVNGGTFDTLVQGDELLLAASIKSLFDKNPSLKEYVELQSIWSKLYLVWCI